MSERDQWVNAVVTITIPLDAPPAEASAQAKQHAVGRILSEVLESLPEHIGRECVGSATWEDVSDD